MFSRASKAVSTASARLSQLSGQLQSQASTTQTRALGTQSTSFKLNTGATIPAVGFGTWQDVNAQEGAVLTALKAGYRHIDGAHVYGTEKAIGRAIKQSGIPRDEIFLTTKLWNNSHHPDDVEKAMDASLRNLQVESVDLYLMHWPSPFARSEKLMPKGEDGKIKTGDTDYIDTWKAMEKLVKAGKAKAIGISNFSKAELERLLGEATIVPAAHQMEFHPYLQQKEFAAWHASKGIHVTQYSPFGNQNPIYSGGKNMGKLIDDAVLVEIGKKHGKSGAQVALAWGIAQGHTVIPKSKTESRIKDNLDCDFKLDQEDLEKIGSIDKKKRFNDPSQSFGWDFYTDLDGKV